MISGSKLKNHTSVTRMKSTSNLSSTKKQSIESSKKKFKTEILEFRILISLKIHQLSNLMLKKRSKTERKEIPPIEHKKGSLFQESRKNHSLKMIILSLLVLLIPLTSLTMCFQDILQEFNKLTSKLKEKKPKQN